MDWYARAFIKASLTWFSLGVALGLAMAAYPAWVIYRPAHAHMNVLGFVTMMIYGIAYHVIPRFTGSRVHSPRLATVQWWVANVGLALLVTGFLARPHSAAIGVHLLIAGGTVSAAAAYMFVYNIWRTIGTERPRAGAAAARPRGP